MAEIKVVKNKVSKIKKKNDMRLTKTAVGLVKAIQEAEAQRAVLADQADHIDDAIFEMQEALICELDQIITGTK